MGLRILVVEDNLDRIEWFQNEFDYKFDLAKDAFAAIGLVNKSKYDMIFLDHDLGDRIFVDSSEPNTGYQVAKTIVNSLNNNTPVIVHSHNPEGVKNIQSVLRPNFSYWIPFGQFNKDILKHLNRAAS